MLLSVCRACVMCRWQTQYSDIKEYNWVVKWLNLGHMLIKSDFSSNFPLISPGMLSTWRLNNMYCQKYSKNNLTNRIQKSSLWGVTPSAKCACKTIQILYLIPHKMASLIPLRWVNEFIYRNAWNEKQEAWKSIIFWQANIGPQMSYKDILFQT